MEITIGLTHVVNNGPLVKSLDWPDLQHTWEGILFTKDPLDQVYLFLQSNSTMQSSLILLQLYTYQYYNKTKCMFDPHKKNAI